MLLLLTLACDPSGSTDSAAPVWTTDVAPILAQRCAGCHETGLAPLRFSAWDDVEALAPTLMSAVESGSMPPWPFQESCRDVSGSLALPDAELQVLRAWSEAGYPRGDGDPVVPEVTVPSPPRPADVEVHPSLAFQVDPSESDPYWCAYVGDASSEERWIEGAEILLDHPEITHHSFLYAVPPTAQAAVDARDDADPLPGFRCDGGLAMADGVSMLSGWAPGGAAWWPMTEGAPAVRVPAGSRLAIEVHYNTGAIDTPTVDTPGWAVWYAPSRPAYQVLTLPIVDLELQIPAGATDWTQTAITRLPVDARLSSTTPHMHGLGQSLTTTLTRADGSEVCLTDIDGWDFNWQFSYDTVDEGIPVDITDTITLSCTWDNADGGDVSWGERTSDEMCLDYVGFLVPSEPAGRDGTCGEFTPCFERCAPDDPFCAMTCMAHSGEACLTCGYEAYFGECTIDACTPQAIALDRCYADCPNPDSDYADCLYTTCSTEWAAYETCWEDHFRDGSCASDAAACTGLTP